MQKNILDKKILFRDLVLSYRKSIFFNHVSNSKEKPGYSETERNINESFKDADKELKNELLLILFLELGRNVDYQKDSEASLSLSSKYQIITYNLVDEIISEYFGMVLEKA